MKNIFQNKKVLISMIVVVVVIVIAIVFFVVLGMNQKKKNGDNSTIKFGEDNSKQDTSSLASGKSSKNTSTNTTANKTESEENDVGEDVDEFYKKAAEKFIAGYMNEKDMETFLEDCVDVKAYVAYYNVDSDESKFFEEYSSLVDGDEKIENVKNNFLLMPKSYETVLMMFEAFSKMAESMDNTTSDTANSIDLTNSTMSFEDISEEDKKLTLKDISKPEKSSDDPEITSIVITCSFWGEDVDMKMIFYGDIVIFVTDEDGKPIVTTDKMDENMFSLENMEGMENEN